MPTTTEIIPENVTTQLPALVDVEGNTIEVPSRLPWGKEKKILSLIGRAVKQIFPDDGNSSEIPAVINDFISYVRERDPIAAESLTKLSEEYLASNPRIPSFDAFKLLSFFAQEAPGLITEVVAIVTGKSVEYIDDNFDGESVVSFAFPYLLQSLQKYMRSFSMPGT